MQPLGVLLCCCGVLGHMAPVHRCVRCVACAVSWPTWLLFTGVPARCVVLRVRCPGPLDSCSLVYVVMRVRCPGPLGCCSTVCSLHVQFCMCGVLGQLAPVHRCSLSVLCFARAVSRATWHLFTGVLARSVVLRVWCPGPLGSCSAMCSLGVLCLVCGVMGLLAPVQRCARSVSCAVGCVCVALLQGANSSIRTAAIPSRQGLEWLPGSHWFIRAAAVCSRQGLGTLGARTRPPGRRLFCSRQGLGSLPGAHTSVRTPAVDCSGALNTMNRDHYIPHLLRDHVARTKAEMQHTS